MKKRTEEIVVYLILVVQVIFLLGQYFFNMFGSWWLAIIPGAVLLGFYGLLLFSIFIISIFINDEHL